ncbi:putative E3 ubiquitin-protein ligase SINA-like 6 [Triticum dicoccoides]|uniref:putative E3 ubiquitin-protein ligase SINA-like 6 n=1 Tax=Triticum dicoccoides TaxID=85692 RepID=UPI001890FA83|nr:putative E3 ubiquitin-protein ligase SINA-like 6 [Triticum dicoccoides]
MQAASATWEERSRGLPSAMEKGGDQSARKARLELVVANGPVKRQMVVHEAGEIVPAEQGPTMQISVKMDVAVLHCPFCFLPFKPPVFQCNGGHLACGDCRGEQPGSQWQCERCERGGAFDIRSTAMEAVVSSARVECPHDGCGRYITYHELDDHQSACPHAACKCPVPGCDFAGPPPALLRHLNTLHSVPVHSVQYRKVLQLQVPVSEPRRLLLAEEDARAFLVVGGALGLGTPLTVSVVCIRAGASQLPLYAAKVWVNGPQAAANGRADTVSADIEVTSSKEPGAVDIEDLTFLTVPSKLLAGAGPSRTVSLHIRIDKITS